MSNRELAQEWFKLAEMNLTDYGVQIRYPFPLDVGEADLAFALKNASQIKDFVLQKFS